MTSIRVYYSARGKEQTYTAYDKEQALKTGKLGRSYTQKASVSI
jgi:hypothetical protein